MPVYRLDPINLSDARWRTMSSIKECVWVEADTPEQARDLVAGRTAIAVAPTVRFAPIQRSPWLDESLSLCVMDRPAIDVPKGEIVKADGSRVE
jgi:hypothetical protein